MAHWLVEKLLKSCASRACQKVDLWCPGGKPSTRLSFGSGSAAKPPEGVPGEAALMLQESDARELAQAAKARPWRSHVCYRSLERGAHWAQYKEVLPPVSPQHPSMANRNNLSAGKQSPAPLSQNRHHSVNLEPRGNKFIPGAQFFNCTHCHTSHHALGIAYSQLTGFLKLNFHKRFLIGLAAFNLHF